MLTKSQVLDNLRFLFPQMSAKEVRDLVGTGNMSVDKLTHLLLHADVPVSRDTPNRQTCAKTRPCRCHTVYAHRPEQCSCLEYLCVSQCVCVWAYVCVHICVCVHCRL